MVLAGVGGELRLGLVLEVFEYFTVVVLVAANGDGLGQSVQAHVSLAVRVSLVYVWTSHRSAFIE